MRGFKINVFTILFIFSVKLNAQVYETDDSSYLVTSFDYLTYKGNFRSRAYLDFKDSLPTGEWILYDSVNKKKNKRRIYIVGHFKDSLRNGKFEYDIFKGKPQIIYHFKNGKLDGTYQEYFVNTLTDEGFYKNGKREGFFIRHERFTGTILSVEKYENDSLKDWIEYYPSIGVPYQKGWGERSYLNGECFEYDTTGQIILSGTYKNGSLIELKEFYPNSIRLKSHSIGVFNKCNYNYSSLFYCDIKLENGIKTFFTENGDLIKTEKYINGIVE